MKWYNCSKASLVWMAFIAAWAIGPGVAVADFTFGWPVNLGPVVNSGYDEAYPCISADGLSLFCYSAPQGPGDDDIWVSTRKTTDDEWGAPVNLGPPVNTSADEIGPSISADSLSLFFSDGPVHRPGGKGKADIWMATRATTADPWGEPVNLGSVNGPSNDSDPSISADGLVLLFGSDRSGGYGGTDIWMATRATPQAPWGEPVNIGPGVNSSAFDNHPSMSADGLVVVFGSTRLNVSGDDNCDLFLARRSTTREPFGPPLNLAEINTVDNEEWPSISFDGRVLFFASTRPGGRGGHDIWQSAIIPVVDFNGDLKVDIKDLLILIEHWGQNYPLCDIGPMPWGDGKVDEKDLEVLMSHWGQPLEVPPDPNLVAHWKLDETKGTLAEDISLAHDATLKGNPVWQPAGGKVGGAILLDGVDDYVQTPFVLNPSQGAFSVLAWVKGGAPGQVILSQMAKANWLSTDANAGRLMTELKAQGSLGTTLQSQSVVTDGNWHRVGLVWDGTNRVLYADDREVARDTQPSLPSSTTGLYMGVGNKLSKGTFWSGLIDDLRIYNRAVKP